jgi:hypothetical protein
MFALVRDAHIRAMVIDGLERGLTITDAATLAGVSRRSVLRVIEIWQELSELESDEERDMKLDEYGEATVHASLELNKAIAHRNQRWIEMGESGGSPAKSALWFLERRAGKEWAPPKQQVESHVVQESRNLSLEESLNSALSALGVNSESIAESGDYWARLATASSTGGDLPSLPGPSKVIDVPSLPAPSSSASSSKVPSVEMNPVPSSPSSVSLEELRSLSAEAILPFVDEEEPQ